MFNEKLKEEKVSIDKTKKPKKGVKVMVDNQKSKMQDAEYDVEEEEEYVEEFNQGKFNDDDFM